MPQKRTTKTGKIRWVARYRDNAGKEHSRSFETRREAKAYEEEQERALRRREWIDPALTSTTIAEVFDRWMQRPGLRESSTRVYRHTRENLAPLGALPALSLTRLDVERWHSQLLKGRPWWGGKPLSERTARLMVAHLWSAMELACEEELVRRNPVKVPRLTRTKSGAVQRSELPSMDEIERVIAQLERGGHPYQNQRGTVGPQPGLAAMVRVALGTGMRISELCGLRVQDVDFLRRVVNVRWQATPSGTGLVEPKTPAARRAIPVADDCLAVLDRQSAGQGSDARVFRTLVQGVPLGSVGAARGLREAVRVCGASFTFHTLRHVFASRLIAAGVSVAGVQHVMGHESPTVTLNVYTHLWPGTDDHVRAALSVPIEGEGSLRDRGVLG